MEEALTQAQELAHPFSSAFALNFAAALYQFLREVQSVQEWTGAVMTLSREQGFPYWLARGTIQQGWVLAERGQSEDGITQMGQGLNIMRATGAELNRSYGLGWLATAYGRVGQIEEGLALLAEGLEIVHKTEDRHHEAELYRLKGELTLQSLAQSPLPDVEEAEACLLKAIEIARRQQAKSLELRASTSLARLWQRQGKRAEAHELLSDVYNWFTEGFDTKDLQEAKALLRELAESAVEYLN
jgi:predicted ATPase